MGKEQHSCNSQLLPNGPNLKALKEVAAGI